MCESEVTYKDVIDNMVKTGEGELVCNFVLRKVEPCRRDEEADEEPGRHLVKARLHTGEHRAWLVEGDLFNIDSWKSAIVESAAIADEALFIGYVRDFMFIQGKPIYGSWFHGLHSCGSYAGNDGRIYVSDPPAGGTLGQNTTYVHKHLPDAGEGSKDTFASFSRVTEDATMQAVLCHALGSVFKVKHTPYPHLALVTESGTGHTLACAIDEGFGFLHVDAREDLLDKNGRKAVLADTNLPVLITGVADLQEKERERLLSDLRQCYEAQPHTWGRDGVLRAPVITLGANLAAGCGGALWTTLFFPLDEAALDSAAIQDFRNASQQFPTRDWLHFACTYAHGLDMQTKLWDKRQWLLERVDVGRLLMDENIEAIISNHAVLLVVAEALRAYGINVDVEDYIVERLDQHLRMWLDKGHDLAVAFLEDLAERLMSGEPLEGPHEIADGGLYISAPDWRQPLGSRYRRPTVCRSDTMTWFLDRHGLGEKCSHAFEDHEQTAVFIPFEKLKELGIEFDT